MKLYLSSYKLGNNIDELKKWIEKNGGVLENKIENESWRTFFNKKILDKTISW